MINIDNLKLTGEGAVKFIENEDLFPVRILFDFRKDDENRTQWLKNREGSIGGSEIGAIAGYSEYASALTVFNDKLGLSEKFKGNIHTKFGTRMEPQIREWLMEDFKEETGIDITTYEYPYTMLDKDVDYFSANIDGLALLKENYVYWENRETGEIKSIPANELIGIEIKTASEFCSKMWAGEEVPGSYYCQCQWYMGITGLNYFLIVYLIGKRVMWKVIPRNDDDIKYLREKGKEFWEKNIIKKVAPAPTGLPKETEQINDSQSLTDDEVVLNNDLLSQYKEADAKAKEWDKEKKRIQQEIYLAMGNAKKGTDGHYKISRWYVDKPKLDTKTLKDKYPETYKTILSGTTRSVNLRVSECR